jgi:energy-coupling factor transporter ATP-binding protein EcfA2
MALEIRQDERVIIIGKSGSGKTTLLKYLVNTLSEEGKYHFVVLDVVGNLGDLAALPDVKYYAVNPYKGGEEDKIFEDIKEPCMVVLDEADQYYYGPSHSSPMAQLVTIGRNYGVGFIAISRRTVDVARTGFLANQNWAFVFGTGSGRDMQTLSSWFGMPPETFSAAHIEKYHFLVFHESELICEGVVE